MSSQPIGIFDSGVGGLTVMSAVQKLLPNESIIYLGDTARVPYGNRSAETILRYTEECCTFLATKNVKAIVVACNTASAHALPYLQHRFHFPLLGVIEPGVKAALKITRNKKIGVIGTRATIESEIYAKALKRLDPDVLATNIACPLFVPLVEEGWLQNKVTESIAREYLAEFITRPTLSERSEREGEAPPALPVEGATRAPIIDTLILGCTHYPLLQEMIQKTVGKEVRLIDSARHVAEALAEKLEEKKIQSDSHKREFLKIYVSDLSERFREMSALFLGEKIDICKATLF